MNHMIVYILLDKQIIVQCVEYVYIIGIVCVYYVYIVYSIQQISIVLVVCINNDTYQCIIHIYNINNIYTYSYINTHYSYYYIPNKRYLEAVDTICAKHTHMYVTALIACYRAYKLARLVVVLARTQIRVALCVHARTSHDTRGARVR